MANKIAHWELMGPDGAQLHAFYADLFGWEGEAVPGFNHYYLLEADTAGLGGAVGQGSEEMPAYMMFYVEVDDVNEHLEKAEQAGGKTVTPRTVVPGVVTFGMFADPAGNVVGVVEATVEEAE